MKWPKRSEQKQREQQNTPVTARTVAGLETPSKVSRLLSPRHKWKLRGKTVRKNGLSIVKLSPNSPMYEEELAHCRRMMIELGPNEFRTAARREMRRRGGRTNRDIMAAKSGIQARRRGPAKTYKHPKARKGSSRRAPACRGLSVKSGVHLPLVY